MQPFGEYHENDLYRKMSVLLGGSANTDKYKPNHNISRGLFVPGQRKPSGITPYSPGKDDQDHNRHKNCKNMLFEMIDKLLHDFFPLPQFENRGEQASLKLARLSNGSGSQSSSMAFKYSGFTFDRN